MLRSVTQPLLPLCHLDLHMFAIAVVKRKQRNCLQLVSDLVLAISNVSSRIGKLTSGMKAHVFD
jgi:hypothetical protein